MNPRNPFLVVLLIGVVCLAAAGVYFAFSPRPAPANTPPIPEPSITQTPPDTQVAPPDTPTNPSISQTPPDPETIRPTLYSRILAEYGDYVSELRPGTHDKTMLEVRATRDDGSFFTPMVDSLLQRFGKEAGFRSATLLLPNAAGSVDRFRIAAEASADPQGHWNVFVR